MFASGIRLSTLVGVLLLVAWVTYLYFFGGPFQFVDYPVLRQSSTFIPPPSWSTPEGRAFDLLYDDGDSRVKGKVEVSVLSRSDTIAIVRAIDNRGDDSVYRTYHLLTMRYELGAWEITRHQLAWSGRGRLGWTTKPTL
jgi:hypothetical protein